MKNLEDYVLNFRTDSNDELQFKINNKEKAFEVFCEMYNTSYGSLSVDDNLICFSTGGWSDNEHLISELKRTSWWLNINCIQQSGGHYYIDLDKWNDEKKHWEIIKK